MKSLIFSLAASALLATLAPTAAQARAQPLAPAVTAPPVSPTDTIIVRLPNKAVMTLTVRDAAQLRELPKYHLDSLVARLGGYIKQADVAAKSSKTDQVTLQFYPDKDQPGQGLPEEIRVTTRKSGADRVDVNMKRGFQMRRERDADGERTLVIRGGKKDTPTDSLRRARRGAHGGVKLHFDFGRSGFVNGSDGPGGAVPSLRTWSSSYSTVGLLYVAPLKYTNSNKLAVTFGPALSFNEFRLQSSQVWTTDAARTSAIAAPSGIRADRSWLNLVTLNLPVMLEYKNLRKDGDRGFSAGVGGFVGYRLYNSHTVRYQVNGSDNEFENNVSGPGLHLNDWQYGLQAELGYSALRFVAKYNLNELFKTGQGPQTQVLSVGLKVSGF